MAVVDAHQHFWNLDSGSYPWLTPESGPIHRTFAAEELEPAARRRRGGRTVLVQAADTYADTDAMLRRRTPTTSGRRRGGLGTADPAGRGGRGVLDRYRAASRVRRGAAPHPRRARSGLGGPGRGVKGLGLLAERRLPFDLVAGAAQPPGARADPRRARAGADSRHRPPGQAADPGGGLGAVGVADRRAPPSYPNVYGKVSGLNTAADARTWTAEDLRPYVDHAHRGVRPRPADVRQRLAGDRSRRRLRQGVEGDRRAARGPRRE